VERGGALGGNHTWSFHSADIPRDARFVEPFVAHRWSRYRVRFRSLERVLEEPYAAVTSESLNAVLLERAARGRLELVLNQSATRVSPGGVELSSGASLEAEVVIDSRGPDRFERVNAIGYQKFVGLELEVRVGTAPAEPVLMDACVEQSDGFHFVYSLPFAPDRVLIEDTYFSDTPQLDAAALRARIARYAEENGIVAYRVLREETGVLPLPARAPVHEPDEPGLIRGGYQGGFFHPTTGYSFPLAVRLALEVARSDGSELTLRVARLARSEARQQRFSALLNRLLFDGFEPHERHRVLERFYRLPAGTVRRFYALQMTPFDRGRVLCGRPPQGFSLPRFWSSGDRSTRSAVQGEQA
jgi:lycopene beta-cyclase